MQATAETPNIESSTNGHSHCLLCGEHNPLGLKLAFRKEGDTVSADFKARSFLQGYRGLLHGGVIASLLDSAMTHCLFNSRIKAVTGDLRVRFLHPVSCASQLKLRAWVVSARPPLYQLRAELTVENRIMAWADAKFVPYGRTEGENRENHHPGR